MTTEEVLELAWAHHTAGRLREAETIYRTVLARERHPLAFNRLGLLAHQTGHSVEAVELLRRAVEVGPDFAPAYNNLGLVLHHLGRHDEAVAALRRAVELDPESSSTHSNLGVCLTAGGLPDEAVAALRRAAELNPADHTVQLNLGEPLTAQGRLDEVIAACRRAIEIEPACGPTAHSALIHTMLFHPRYGAQAVRAEQRAWNERYAVPLRPARPAWPMRGEHPNDRNPGRRLKVGYVSADFRDHVVGQNILPLFREHDHARFEVFCYSNSADAADALTRTLQGHADVWHDVAGASDEQLADRIRQDRVDVLVDLSLHLAGNRLPVFARQPAPVQASFAGYPGSSGVETIPYRITDPFLDPPHDSPPDDSSPDDSPVYDMTQRAARDDDRPMRVPHSFWCYDPPPGSPEPGGLPALRNGYVTFASFNNFAKVNEPVLRVWAGVMRELESSRLIILAAEGSHRAAALAVLEAGGVARDRVEFVRYLPLLEYLTMYQRVDVALDSFPYGAHTTGLDAFWMGVPVPTIAGDTPVSRAGVSHLSNLGLPELIAADAPAYVKLTADLSRDLPRLAGLRTSLRERMRRSPLTDPASFARGIEAALRRMWEEYCADKA